MIRSHRQHPATTCWWSRVVFHLSVQVRGCPWSSVAVDAETDVGQGIFVRGLRSALYPVAKHLIPDQVFHDQCSSTGQRDHRSCTLGLVGHPVGLAQPDHAAAQGQPSTEPVRVHVVLPLGGRVVALEGGRRDAPPCPPRRSDCCARAIPEACPPGEGTDLFTDVGRLGRGMFLFWCPADCGRRGTGWVQ
jgi:hypothetical protein